MNNSRTSFKKSAVIILAMFGLLLPFQNCAPIGGVQTSESTDISSSSGDGETPLPNDGSLPPPPTGEPPPAEPPPPPPPVGVDPCANNRAPVLSGYRPTGQTTVQTTVPNQNARIGMATNAGTQVPGVLTFVGNPGAGEDTQTLSLRCNVAHYDQNGTRLTGNNSALLAVSCTNNGGVNMTRDGSIWRANLTTTQAEGRECLAGRTEISVFVRDQCNANSTTMNYTIQVADGCLPTRKVVASDATDKNDQFGHQVALTGTYAAVVASENDQNGMDSGAVYVYQVGAGNLSFEAKLRPTDVPYGGNNSGLVGATLRGVALNGTTLAVGSPYYRSGSVTSGAVFIFNRVNGVWTQTQRILPAGGNAGGGDTFGDAVALSGNTLVVGAPRDSSRGVTAGAAYVYTLTGNDFVLAEKITAPNAAARQLFGYSVAVDGSLVAVGAPVDTVFSEAAGFAYVFNRGTGSTTEISGITSRPADIGQRARFGESVGISGSNLVVGATLASNPSGNNGSVRSGAAFVYSISAAGASFRNKLFGSANQMLFGHSVSISGSTVVVGSPGDAAETGGDMGAAYLFQLPAGATTTAVNSSFRIMARDRLREDRFGFHVGVASGRVLIGTPMDNLLSSETVSQQEIERGGSAHLVTLP